MNPALKVIDGLPDHVGAVNVTGDVIQSQIAASIRRGHPQAKQQAPNAQRVCLVGGGPSLAETEGELVDLLHAGAKLVTVNAAYHWCLERNLKPSAQIVLDARAGNARFVDPVVPSCHYLLASQCHAETWDRVEGRPNVWIWHAMNPDDSGERCIEQALLDAYYLKRWHGVSGGTTVMMRAIMLLRVLGYLRFDLFGCDSCFLGSQHHAYAQPENDRDKRLRVTISPNDRPDLEREFFCAPWHVKQAEDFLQMIRFNGEKFLLNVHGDGLLAYMLRPSAAGVTVTTHEETVEREAAYPVLV